jgi:hypothetical protein
MRHDVVAAAITLVVLGSAASGAVVERPLSSSERSYLISAASSIQAEPKQEKPAPPADDAPPTRAQILKEGPTALQQNCTKCHGSDKWEATNRDREGWAAIVNEMARQMANAKMPPMSQRTTNIIIDYLALSQPQ